MLVLLFPAALWAGTPHGSPTDRVLGLLSGNVVRTALSYDCADLSCKVLSSCEEACFKLIECGQSKRDGDNDGIPCENLCSRPCPR